MDCPDNSDEGLFCKQAPSCAKLGCAYKCSVTWRGPKCYCRKGSQPDPSANTKCIDEDECQVYNCFSRSVVFLLDFITYNVNIFVNQQHIDFIIQIPGKCDQRCKNLEGSYECGCESGYNIRPDNHTCQAYNEPDPYELPSLIYANSINVKRAYLETDESSRDVNVKGRYFSQNTGPAY